MVLPFICIFEIYSSTVKTSGSTPLSLSDVGPLTAEFSSNIEYRDLIYGSLDIKGKEYAKKISGVLDSKSSMCYFKSDIMGLSVTDTMCNSSYGCGESFKMDIGIDYIYDPASYNCILLSQSKTRHDSILGINLIDRLRAFPVLTLIPSSPSEIKFSPTGLAEYTVSTGTLIAEDLNENIHCIGDIAKVNFQTTRTNKRIFLSTVSFIISNQCSESITELKVLVEFDTALAQSEYSSNFMDLMADFEYLQWTGKGPEDFIIERKNLKMFKGHNMPYLKIGVDIIRNLAISFDWIALYFCKPKFSSTPSDYQGIISDKELHVIQANVQRDPILTEPVKILIKYDVTVQVEIIDRNDELIFLTLDTGSDFTHLPASYTSEKGDSLFYCSYADGKEERGCKTALSITFPTRQMNSVESKTYTLISGINGNLSQGMIGLQYRDNAMDSLPYIWNVEWMVFIPEVIKSMESVGNLSKFKNGRGLGILELTNDFNTAELCQGDILSFKADRANWKIEGLRIEFIISNGNMKVFILDKVLIDTGYTMSQLASYPMDEINEAEEIWHIKYRLLNFIRYRIFFLRNIAFQLFFKINHTIRCFGGHMIIMRNGQLIRL
jgi:hypothetical protein